jgi:SAM-dependent methyltransferase
MAPSVAEARSTARDARAEEMFAWQQRMLREYGYELPPGSRVLDFGSGAGALVDTYRAAGLDSYGCDIEIDRESDRQRLIETDPYRIPYPDDWFDLVVSNQVFEHVQNPEEAFAEIARVLKPGGLSLHMFPGRYRIREGHVFVPFASVFRPRWWLRLWAAAGVRNEFQHGLPSSEVADRNHEFLTSKTRYLTRRELKRAAPGVIFVESLQIEMAVERRGLPRALRALAPFYSAFRSRIIITRA